MIYKYPAGIILPFDTSCPSEWTRVSSLDGKFLVGSAIYDGTGGGTDTHEHIFNPAPRNTDLSTSHSSNFGPDDVASGCFDYHAVNLPSILSGAAAHTPPYINVVFCKKQ
jgi:hypothetical protein